MNNNEEIIMARLIHIDKMEEFPLALILCNQELFDRYQIHEEDLYINIKDAKKDIKIISKKALTDWEIIKAYQKVKIIEHYYDNFNSLDKNIVMQKTCYILPSKDDQYKYTFQYKNINFAIIPKNVFGKNYKKIINEFKKNKKIPIKDILNFF